MNKKHTDKLPLYIGIGLPIVLIIYIIATVYLPSLFIKPQYNFIYTKGCYEKYNIQVDRFGKVIWSPRAGYDSSNTQLPDCFFLYNVSQDSSKPITYDQITGLSLDSSSKSPDGFIVQNNNGNNLSFFPLNWYDSTDNNGVYLRGHGLNKRIDDTLDYYNSQFIGWVLK